MIATHTSSAQQPSAEQLRLLAENRELRARVLILESENSMLLARISELVAKLAAETNRDRQQALALEIEILQDRIAQRNREQFGSKSEKRGRPEQDQPQDVPARKIKRSGSARTKQPELPHVTVRHLLDQADQICPSCGGKLYTNGDKCERSERIVVSERVYTVVTDEKQVYGCGGCGHSEAALAPAQLVPGGRYDSSIAINVAVDKYVDHMPLNRQVRAMGRAGLQTTRQALWNQLEALKKLCEPSYLAQHDWMLAAHRMLHADETSWRMMVDGGSTRWWLWGLAAKDGFFCMTAPSRDSKAARLLLRNYDGGLMSDAYVVYKSLAAKGKQEPLDVDDEQVWRPAFSMFVCWSHARRPFDQAAKSNDQAHEILDLIAKLYAVESRAKEQARGDPIRLRELTAELRASESSTIIEEIDRWRAKQLVLPGTKMAQGLGFLSNQWRELTAFLSNPDAPLDNNLIEREVRTPVLGRKNHLGSHSPNGAHVSAVFYTLLGSCRLVGVSPVRYLRTLVERGLQTKGYALLPHEFAAELAAQG